MTAPTKYPDLIYKIAFFQCITFATKCKYTLSVMEMSLMKLILFIMVIPAVLHNSCRKSELSPPVCIQQKIEEIKTGPKWNPAADINEDRYHGQSVFLITANCCDQYMMLYDGSCVPICAPAGGFAGKGDGKCPDFYNEAVHLKLVWKDSR